MRKSYEMDMTRGPLLRSILIFTLPLLLSGVLQLLFNATDIVVVGQFAGANAMASVGSTTSLFNLLINAFIGISVGANVLVARYCGEKTMTACSRPCRPRCSPVWSAVLFWSCSASCSRGPC